MLRTCKLPQSLTLATPSEVCGGFVPSLQLRLRMWWVVGLFSVLQVNPIYPKHLVFGDVMRRMKG